MAASREKLRAHRKKVHAKKEAVSTKLVEPISAEPQMVLEKIKVQASSSRSALVPGEGRSMGMDID
jgi:large subunit ribosomal protein L24e